MCAGHGDRMQRIKDMHRLPVIKSKQITYLSSTSLRVYLSQQVREADHSPASSAEAKNDGATHLLPHTFSLHGA
jgi:hypothetical protein